MPTTEERIAWLERQVDALTIAVQCITHGATPGVLGTTIIDQSWIVALTEKYGDEGAADVIIRLNQLGMNFETAPLGD